MDENGEGQLQERSTTELFSYVWQRDNTLLGHKKIVSRPDVAQGPPFEKG